jgi:hypothetical protein
MMPEKLCELMDLVMAHPVMACSALFAFWQLSQEGGWFQFPLCVSEVAWAY